MNIRAAACLAFAASLISACSVLRPEPPLRSLSGVDLYQQLCASCHGFEGRGDGPVASLIKIGVPDLTRLAWRNGGGFPTDNVRQVVDGRSDRRAHGPRDMPVWGWQLYDSRSEDDATARARTDALIDKLVRYLESIQQF